MNTLQWALLLLGAGIALMLILSSRREKKALERLNTPNAPPASRDWGMEREAMTGPAPGPEAGAAKPAVGAAKPAAPGSFDEWGVGRARKVPSLGVSTTLPPGTRAPDLAKPAEKAPEKLIGLYIAEHEGTSILGPKIHAALQARGLRFGLRKIYHRYGNEQPLYSVASLVKPGSLEIGRASCRERV